MKVTEFIQTRIYTIREKRVMLDSDIALLYNVEAEIFNRTIKINIRRFPRNCMLRLTKKERKEIPSIQANQPLPSDQPQTAAYAFTSDGIAMLSGIFDSARVVKVNIAIMQVFTESGGEAAKK
ncbi:MAG: ORF6N domain-containing protein [Chitinophagaceae bacterium]|nr:ORF6N domain-containing protein [Chitinophagaceae bacterium]